MDRTEKHQLGPPRPASTDVEPSERRFAELQDTMREGKGLSPVDSDDSLLDLDTSGAAYTEIDRSAHGPGTDSQPSTSDWGDTLIHHNAFDESDAGSSAPKVKGVGERIGSYEVIGRLGYGAMAEVLLAKSSGERGFARKVAIKRLLPEVAANPDTVEMFIDEARISSGLNHGNIAQIIDFGKVGDTYYLAMEHVEGTSLRAILDYHEQRGLPPAIAAHVVAKICAALDYAHARSDDKGRPLRIVHRDVKPSNVIISVDGEIKLIDFGVAKAAERLHHTLGATIKGSFAYMSPEQAAAEHIDHRSDIFSCGTVLYELLAGDNPFIGVSSVDTLERVRHVHMAPLKSAAPNVPPELERSCGRAMAVDPRERFQNAGEMQADLERFCQQSVKLTEVKRALAALVSEVRAHENEADAVPPAPSRGTVETAYGRGQSADSGSSRREPTAAAAPMHGGGIESAGLRPQSTVPIKPQRAERSSPMVDSAPNVAAPPPRRSSGSSPRRDVSPPDEHLPAPSPPIHTVDSAGEPTLAISGEAGAYGGGPSGLRPAPTTLDANSFPELATYSRRDDGSAPRPAPPPRREPIIVTAPDLAPSQSVDTGMQPTLVADGSSPLLAAVAPPGRRPSPSRQLPQAQPMDREAYHRAPTTLDPEPSDEILKARKQRRRQSRDMRQPPAARAPAPAPEPADDEPLNLRMWILVGGAVVLAAFVAGLVVALVR